MIRWLLPVAVVAAIGAGGAIAASAATSSSAASVKSFKSSQFGTVLVAANGKTLYRYTLDGKGVNRCTSVSICAKYWPQLLVKAGVKPVAGSGVKASLLGTIKAAKGMLQITYGGHPLYYFAGDKKAGDMNGQGFDKQWYVVDAKGAFVKHAVSSGSSGSGTGGGYSNPAPATTTSSDSGWG